MAVRVADRLRRRWDNARHRVLDFADRFGGSGPRRRPDVANLSSTPSTGIAIVGCGFVADFYAATLALHPELELVGAADRDRSRAERFASSNGVQSYASVSALLADPRVEIVVNLTNPESHFAVSKQSLDAGKHVYSEKPLAMTLSEAKALVELAEAKGLLLAGAPCSVLGETAEALRGSLARNEIGPVRLVYAELDDGPIHRMHPEEWQSPRGTPWPWRDEFTVGCTMEHAGYHLTWLVALFGPAESVTAFASRRVPQKHHDLAPEACAPDFSVACIRFRSGVVARLTCSIVAPHDHSLRIIGDDGVLSVDECWHYGAPVLVRRFTDLDLRAETYPWLARGRVARSWFGLHGRKTESSPKADFRRRIRRHEMDYALGVAELAASLRGGRRCRLTAGFALHVNEIALAIHNAGETGSQVTITSTCAPF